MAAKTRSAADNSRRALDGASSVCSHGRLRLSSVAYARYAPSSPHDHTKESLADRTTRVIGRASRGLFVVFLLVGCSRAATDPNQGPSGFGPNTPETPIPDPPSDATGAELYAAQCAACHGPAGYGGVAPKLAGYNKGEDVFVPLVTRTMPVARPEACDEACAKKIFDALATIAPPIHDPCVDDTPRYLPRSLRLLTRRELRNTVDTILPAPACGEHVFVFTPTDARPSAVLLSGSFNGWAETESAGAWPLVWSDLRGAFVLRRTLVEGAHSYKFVVDGTWLVDPANPNRAPDGFGGQNALIDVACTGVDAAPDPYERLPDEIRPEGFPFDDHVTSAVVTTVHVDEHFETTRLLAARVALGLDRYEDADDFVSTFGADVFRRPLKTDESARYRAIIADAPTISTGIERAARVMLASPRFLYRAELGAPDGDTFVLDGYETANALAYFLWAAPPDEALYASAARGDLIDGEARRAEAERMLADPRASATLGAFAVAWLGAEKVSTVDKHPEQYGALTEDVRTSMRASTAEFFSHVALEGDGKLDTLYTADFGFVDDTLARFHGWPPAGETLERTVLPADRHAGVLTHGAVLASYAHSDQTSPILRGKLVRERILCQVFGVPPPDAGGVPNVDPNATTRERFREHTDRPACNACHRYIDEVGFAFEGFDAIGRARLEENGLAIDTSGVLEDVEQFGADTRAPFDGVPELGAHLAASDRAATCFATQVWRYQTGRMDELDDACTIARVADRFRTDGRDIRGLLLDLIADDAFVRRRE